MDYINILKDLSTYPGVSGQEDKLSGYIAKLFEKYCDSVEIDEFYNVIGIKKGIGGSGGRRIMVTAHLDEIGLMVKSIDEKGFITVSNIGGVDSKVLLAQEVVIHGKKEIYGIIGAKPPHLLTPEEIKKAVKMEDLVIDTGLSAEEVRKYVSVGDIVTFKVEPLVLQNNRFSSKPHFRISHNHLIIEAFHIHDSRHGKPFPVFKNEAVHSGLLHLFIINHTLSLQFYVTPLNIYACTITKMTFNKEFHNLKNKQDKIKKASFFNAFFTLLLSCKII